MWLYNWESLEFHDEEKVQPFVIEKKQLVAAQVLFKVLIEKVIIHFLYCALKALSESLLLHKLVDYSSCYRYS